MKVRAKFHCYEATPYPGEDNGVDVKFYATTGEQGKMTDEDYRFWQATPCGTLTMTIKNAVAAKAFEPGKDYYLDFTPAPEE